MKAIYFEIPEDKKQKLNIQLAVLNLKMNRYGKAMVDLLLRYPEETSPEETKLVKNLIKEN